MKQYRPSKITMQEDHDRWLMKRGVHPSQLALKSKISPDFPNYHTDKVAPTSDKVGNGFVASKKRYSGVGVHIGQAYNKGNLVVLSQKEASDSATGKRRT